MLTMQGVRQNWSQAWDLFAEAALHPTFPEAEVQVVRGQMIDAAKRRSDDPDEYLTYLADSLFYAGSRVLRRAGGTSHRSLRSLAMRLPHGTSSE